MPMRTEMFWIGGNRQQRLRRGFEQQVINDRLVLEGDVGHRGWEREHDVEVTDRKKVGLALRKPGPRSCALALRTVPVAAGVIGDPPLAAVFTSFNMPAKRCGAAVLNRRHHLHLVEAQMPGMGDPIFRTSSMEDIGDLKRGLHGLAVGRRLFRFEQTKSIQRTSH